MRSIIRVLGNCYQSYEEALQETKRHDEHRNYLFGYVQNKEDQFQSVVYIDNQEQSPAPKGDGVEELKCVTGIKLA